MATILYLIRHAEAEGNLFRRINGQYDSKITYLGYKQIEALVEKLKHIHIDTIYSSDLIRAITTANSVGKYKGLRVNTTKNLREISVGCWENKLWGNLMKDCPEQYENFKKNLNSFNVEGAESVQQMIHRFHKEIQYIVSENRDKHIAVFSHGTVIKCYLSYIMNIPLEEIDTILPVSDNTSITKIVIKKERYEVEYANDASHLSSDISTTAKQLIWRNEHKDSNGLYIIHLSEKETNNFICELNSSDICPIHISKSSHFICFKAFMRDEEVGFILNSKDEVNNCGIINFIYMKPEYRRRRNGVQLIGESVSYFRKCQCRIISINILDNSSRNFFVKAGFIMDSGNCFKMEYIL